MLVRSRRCAREACGGRDAVAQSTGQALGHEASVRVTYDIDTTRIHAGSAAPGIEQSAEPGDVVDLLAVEIAARGPRVPKLPLLPIPIAVRGHDEHPLAR